MDIGIFTRGLPDQPEQRARGLGGLPATRGEAIGAAFDEALRFNPTASLFRAARRAAIDSPMLTAAQAQEQYGLSGQLKFSEDVPTHVARDLYELKVQELARRSIAERAPGGFWQGAGELGAGFAGGVVDPINILSAFVPFVREARMAAMTASWGAGAARLGRGAIEGAAGAALVEPIVYGVAQQEQADYSALDSLLNVTFGAALGGGLHYGFGAIGDALAARRGGTPAASPPPASPAGPSAIPPQRPADGPATPSPAAAPTLPPDLERFAPPPVAPAPPPAAPPVLATAVDEQGLMWREQALRTAVVDLVTFGEVRGLDAALPTPANAVEAGRDQVARARVDTATQLFPGIDNPDQLLDRLAAAAALAPDEVAQLRQRLQAGGAALVERRPDQLRVDAQTFQFKTGGDAAGVTDRLKGVQRWDQRLAGVTLVWRRADGVEFIADGHQRHGLAARLKGEGQDPRLNVWILSEADGVTPAGARVIAALKNVAEGTGTALDAAKVLRELRTDPRLQVVAAAMPPLPPNSPLVRDAGALAQLGDDAFRMVINNVADQAHAAHVGRLIADPQQQVAALGVLAKANPRSSNEARLLVEQIRAAGFVDGRQESLFGVDAFAQSLFVERARILDRAAALLRKDRAVFATLVDEQGRITDAGNALSLEANQRRLTENETLALLLTDATRAGAVVGAELDAAARALAKGERIGTVVATFLDRVRERIRDGIDPRQLLGPARPDAQAPGARPAADAGGAAQGVGPTADQGGLFEAPPPRPAERAAPADQMIRQEVVIAETGERLQMERPAAAVLAETEARVDRLKQLLACLRS